MRSMRPCMQEPMYCVETALKLLLWSCMVYDWLPEEEDVGAYLCIILFFPASARYIGGYIPCPGVGYSGGIFPAQARYIRLVYTNHPCPLRPALRIARGQVFAKRRCVD